MIVHIRSKYCSGMLVRVLVNILINVLILIHILVLVNECNSTITTVATGRGKWNEGWSWVGRGEGTWLYHMVDKNSKLLLLQNQFTLYI